MTGYLNIAVGTVLLWALVALLYRRILRTAPEALPEAHAQARVNFVFILPRVFAGLIGAGFIAALLPQEAMRALFGESAGWGGVLIATALGALTPGGPFVAFAIAAAAFQAGATEPPLVAYLTAWCVYCLNRTFAFEIPMMGSVFAWQRTALSLPLPFVLAGVAWLF